MPADNLRRRVLLDPLGITVPGLYVSHGIQHENRTVLNGLHEQLELGFSPRWQVLYASVGFRPTSLWHAMWRWSLSLIAAGTLLVNEQVYAPMLQATPRQTIEISQQQGPPSASKPPELDLRLPQESKSICFAVIGDSGTGKHEQYEVAKQMETYYEKVRFDFVIMLGDNIYGAHHPDDLRRKFEVPYHVLLDAGVKFYAALGNHDDPEQERLYKPFNMGGQRYYTFKKGDVQFFVLDSTYMDANQLMWVEQTLQKSTANWKVAYFHHPLYSDGKTHGPDLDLRTRLTPLFRQYGVNVVFSGHEHVYERLKPQDSISYFILGNSGKLMTHDFKSAQAMQKGFDSDRGFMLVEIAGNKLYFQTISRAGHTIDSGSVERR